MLEKDEVCNTMSKQYAEKEFEISKKLQDTKEKVK